MPNNRIMPGLVPGMILFKQAVLAQSRDAPYALAHE